jgi:hypothetical protein
MIRAGVTEMVYMLIKFWGKKREAIQRIQGF